MKTSVLWWKCVRAVLVAVAIIELSGSGVVVSAQDPSSQPLVQFADLAYVGAFRLPRAAANGDDFSLGGKPFAFNPANSSIFVGSKAGRVAEVAIPQLVNTANVNGMLFGSYVQAFADPVEGNIWQVAPDGAFIDGILVQDGAMYGSAGIYYDANNIQRVSHYMRSMSLSTPSFSGMKTVWQADHAGFVSGFMSTVPPEWQDKLGGKAITGQCCTPIAWKTSWGPSAFAFDPADIGSTSPVAATPLLYYSHEHPTLGHWSATGIAYGATTRVNGVAIVSGTRTVLFFGSTGHGPACYGNGTNVQSLHGTPSPDGTIWCYDPASTDKGSHAYPYRYQMWAYDLNELVAVKEGRKQPWEVLPYGVWPFDLPVHEPHARIGGVAYDAGRQLLYISQMFADTDTFAGRALVHALRINGAPVTNTTPTAPDGPTPSGSGTVGAVGLVPSRTSPQLPGTTISWTATPSGGITPYQYKWFVYNGTSWSNSGWVSSNTFNWTPTVASQYYRVAVWVRSYGAIGDQPEASRELWYTISSTTAPPPPTTTTSTPTARTTAVSLGANLAAPQAPNTSITWTATPSGGVSPHQYQWWVYNGSWTAVTSWTTSNTFVWRPTTASSNYRVAVWVRSAGSSLSNEATAEKFFAIAASTIAAPPPPTAAPAPRATGVTLTSNLAQPQVVNTTIAWTAAVTGGVAPYQYQWWTFNGSSWTSTPWTSSNTFAWRPATASLGARVAVWVRSAGNTGNHETSAEKYFAIRAQ
jgi:hypothetical protein